MNGYHDFPGDYSTLGDRMTEMWERGLRIARRVAIAFGLSTALAIWVGAAVTDSALAQIVVTVLAAVGFWPPMLVLTIVVGRLFQRRARSPGGTTIDAAASPTAGNHWQRLAAVAPRERERLQVLKRSLEKSHESFRSADLDPDAHDLCVLIDRRLPELIDRELESLPPDDRGRNRQIGELVDLVEQFVRHCGRKRDGDRSESTYQAEILRRRFENRLSGSEPLA